MSSMRDRLLHYSTWGETRLAVTEATPMTMPAAAIQQHQHPVESELYYEALEPIITTDGAVIASRSGAPVPDAVPAGKP